MRFFRLLIVALGFILLICKPALCQEQETGIDKDMLKEPDKMVSKGLSLLNNLPAFKRFMQQHSALASLFRLPGNYGTPQSLGGLQTRAQVQQQIHPTFLNGPGNTAGSTLGDATYGMTIYSSGQVGIATSFDKTSFPDLNYKLLVSGGIRARKVKVDQDIWPDYVFHAGYRLRTLTEVEQYVQQHQHLSEVPSAEEVEREELDPGDNQATLLKVIEELTLYVIEQSKKTEDQNMQLRSVQERMKLIEAENKRLRTIAAKVRQ